MTEERGRLGKAELLGSAVASGVPLAGFPPAISFAQAAHINQLHPALKFWTAWSPAKQRCESVIQMTGSVIYLLSFPT